MKTKDLIENLIYQVDMLTGEEKDVDKLESLGVGKLFGPGTPVQETIDYITDWVNINRR